MVGDNLKRVHTAIFTIFSFWVNMAPRIGFCLMFRIEDITYDVVFGFLRDNLTKVRDSGLSRDRESSLTLLVFHVNQTTIEETIPIGFDVVNPHDF